MTAAMVSNGLSKGISILASVLKNNGTQVNLKAHEYFFFEEEAHEYINNANKTQDL